MNIKFKAIIVGLITETIVFIYLPIAEGPPSFLGLISICLHIPAFVILPLFQLLPLPALGGLPIVFLLSTTLWTFVWWSIFSLILSKSPTRHVT
jgi:hypothetical protein